MRAKAEVRIAGVRSQNNRLRPAFILRFFLLILFASGFWVLTSGFVVNKDEAPATLGQESNRRRGLRLRAVRGDSTGAARRWPLNGASGQNCTKNLIQLYQESPVRKASPVSSHTPYASFSCPTACVHDLPTLRAVVALTVLFIFGAAVHLDCQQAAQARINKETKSTA